MTKIARSCAVSERTVHRVVRRLEKAGLLSRVKEGNHNVYTVNADAKIKEGPLRSVSEFLRAFAPDES